MRNICDECGGKLVVKKIDYSVRGISVGKFPAEVCIKCGEEVFDKKTSIKIEKIEKQKGLFGLARKVEAIN